MDNVRSSHFNSGLSEKFLYKQTSSQSIQIWYKIHQLYVSISASKTKQNKNSPKVIFMHIHFHFQVHHMCCENDLLKRINQQEQMKDTQIPLWWCKQKRERKEEESIVKFYFQTP